MIQQEETICAICKTQFSDHNIPRLLTMCGHTFCEKCIKDLISKKKNQNKYKLICPLDMMTMELQNPNPSVMPKNLSIMNLVQKKKNQRFSDAEKKTLPFQNTNQNNSNLQVLQFDSKKSIANRTDTPSSQSCLLHQKPLQIVCVRDCQRICTSCAIFGEHKNHKVKKISQIEQLSIKLLQKLKEMQKNQKDFEQKICFRQLHDKVEHVLQVKKKEFEKEIKKKFKQLSEVIELEQKKALLNLDRKMSEHKNKIKGNLNQKQLLKQKYKDWQIGLQQKINLLEAKENEEQKLKVTLRSDNFIEQIEKNMSIFKEISLGIVEQNEKLLNCLTISFDFTGVKNNLKQFCLIQDYNNSFLDLNASIIHAAKTIDDESLLEENQSEKLIQSSLLLSQKLTNSQVREKRDSNIMSLIRSNQINRMNNTSKQRFSSLTKNNSVLKSKKILSMSNKNLGLINELRSKKIPQKFEARIENILKGQLDVLDLTNGQLGDRKTLNILEVIQKYPVTIIKLVKNRLTDQFLLNIIPSLNNIIMLNISRNQLTQKSLENIINARNQGNLKSLKSLMIGQNKIIERNHRSQLEQLKKLGINVCI